MGVKEILLFSWVVIMLNPKMLEDGSVSASPYYRKIIGVDGPRHSRFNNLCRTMLKYRLHLDWSRLISHLRRLSLLCAQSLDIWNTGLFLGEKWLMGQRHCKTYYICSSPSRNLWHSFSHFPSRWLFYYPTQSNGFLWGRLSVAAPMVATTCDSSIALPWSEIWWCKSQDIVYQNPLTKQPIFEVTSNSLWRWSNSCHEYYRMISMMPTPSQAMFLMHLCYSRASDWVHNRVWNHW